MTKMLYELKDDTIKLMKTLIEKMIYDIKEYTNKKWAN